MRLAAAFAFLCRMVYVGATEGHVEGDAAKALKGNEAEWQQQRARGRGAALPALVARLFVAGGAREGEWGR